jgi:hypothetical protein
VALLSRNRTAYDPYGAIAEIRAALGASQMTARELWYAYVQVGGDMSRPELGSALAAESLPDQMQYQLISEALNERLRSAS